MLKWKLRSALAVRIQSSVSVRACIQQGIQILPINTHQSLGEVLQSVGGPARSGAFISDDHGDDNGSDLACSYASGSGHIQPVVQSAD